MILKATLCGTGTAPNASGREVALWPGAIAWMLFCVVAVALRGVRWDEEFEMAQVVLGIVHYPVGHPAPICMRNALNLQIYLSSGLLWLSHSALVVCAFRNVLFLAATVLPVYLIGGTLSGSAVCGHLAAALALFGMQDAFAGCYPLSTWPGYFSTGHIGQGYALLLFWMFLAGRYRSAAFFLGLMPCFHIGQMPITLGFVVLALIYDRHRFGRQIIIRLAWPWFAFGLGLCVLLFQMKGFINAPFASEGAYVSTADANALWHAYETHDAHRVLPGGAVRYANAFFALGVFLFLGAGAVRLSKHESNSGGPWLALLAYGLVVAAAVWGIMPLHALLGSSAPYMLIGWMPYRFTNHALLLLLPMLVALLWRENRPGRCLIAIGILLGLARPLAGWVLPTMLYTRYVASGEGILFLICGGALCLLDRRMGDTPGFRMAWRITGLMAFGILMAEHQFGAACLVMGYTLAYALSFLSKKAVLRGGGVERTPRFSLLVLITVVILSIQQFDHRQQLPITALDRNIRDYLAQRGETDAMLVARPDQYSGQARIGHPFLVDGPLPGWIPYMPSVGPVLDKLHREVYGFTLGRPENGPDWEEVWMARSPEEWQRLAAAYGFSYILAPRGIALHLPEAVTGERDILYRVGP